MVKYREILRLHAMGGRHVKYPVLAQVFEGDGPCLAATRGNGRRGHQGGLCIIQPG